MKNINYELLLSLTNQDINVFNLSNEFYSDICYHFDSPTNKDITLKDRLLEFYPNVTLCDSSCHNIGVNLTTMTAICQCQFIDIMNSEFIKDNFLIKNTFKELLETISQSNIEVLKCYKYIFKYFKNSYGGFIVIFFILIQIILTIIFLNGDLFKTKKYIYNFTQSYIYYLLETKNNTNEKDEEQNNVQQIINIKKENYIKNKEINMSNYNMINIKDKNKGDSNNSIIFNKSGSSFKNINPYILNNIKGNETIKISKKDIKSYNNFDFSEY